MTSILDDTNNRQSLATAVFLAAITGLFSLFLAGSVHAADLPEAVTGSASAGLIQIATTGNPEGLHRELGGKVESSTVVSETVGQATLDGLLDTSRDEHLAPKALVAPTGEIYAMVAPTLTKDNFVLVTTDGQARRMDVGVTEGTNRPFQVAAIVSDGGTPWYTELWYWATRQ